MLFVILFSSTSASAQWNEGDEKIPIPDTGWRVSSGDFAAMLLITNDPESFFEQWNKPASPDYKPNISTVEKANRGDTVMAITLFAGCEADDRGNCDSEIDFKVLKPDGSMYSEHNNAELWIEKTSPPKGTLQVSKSNLGFKVEAEDPLGKYLVEIVIRDNNSKKQLELIQSIIVEE